MSFSVILSMFELLQHQRDESTEAEKPWAEKPWAEKPWEENRRQGMNTTITSMFLKRSVSK